MADTQSPYLEIRKLMHLYSRLSRERGHNKVRLQNNVLCVVFPEFTESFPEVGELVPRTILKHYPEPSLIAAENEEVFVNRIVELADPTIKRTKVRRCHQLAKQSIGVPAGAGLSKELNYLLADMKRIRKEQEEILSQVQQLCKQLKGYQLLQTIPGVGPVLAAIILSEVGDIRTYQSSRQLLKLAGLNLAQIQSGMYNGSVHISKRGKPALRSALYQVAMVAVRQGGPLRLKYLSLVQKHALEKGSKKKAIVAIACKLLRVVYHVLRYEEPFEKNYVGESDAAFFIVRANACA